MKLHEFIGAHRSGILTLSERKMRALSPQIDSADVDSSMAQTLDDIVDALVRDEAPARERRPAKPSDAAVRRGRQRHGVGANIATVALDYGTLCDSIFTVAVQERLVCSPREYQVLNLTLDSSVAAAVEEYMIHSRHEQRQEATHRMAVLVHELRNALTAASIAFAAVARSSHGGVQSKTVAALARGLARMRDLVEQTLAAAKLEAGVAPDARRLRIGDLLDEARAALVLERNVQLEIEGDPAIALEADPVLLLSVLTNLLGNAVKFTRPGSTIVVRTRQDERRMILEVEDACGGLPEGRGRDLFEPFTQAGPDRRGIGLGLSIVRDVVHAHRGEVGVRDRPGQGCVFSFWVPLRHDAQAGATESAVVRAGAAMGRSA